MPAITTPGAALSTAGIIRSDRAIQNHVNRLQVLTGTPTAKPYMSEGVPFNGGVVLSGFLHSSGGPAPVAPTDGQQWPRGNHGPS